MKKIKLKEEKIIPKRGTLYTIDEFIKECDYNLITDEKGVGYYASIDEDKKIVITEILVIPSEIYNGKIKIEFNYIFWLPK